MDMITSGLERDVVASEVVGAVKQGADVVASTPGPVSMSEFVVVTAAVVGSFSCNTAALILGIDAVQ